MKMNQHDLFYGFGETSGLICKNNSRITLNPKDCLGYNAEKSNPLYKHFPWLICYNPKNNYTYGMLYDNFSETEFNLGQEVDAMKGAVYRYY